jgi:hypothetical protein
LAYWLASFGHGWRSSERVLRARVACFCRAITCRGFGHFAPKEAVMISFQTGQSGTGSPQPQLRRPSSPRRHRNRSSPAENTSGYALRTLSTIVVPLRPQAAT